MSKTRDSIDRLEALTDASSEGILEMSDKELVAVMKDAGLNPDDEENWVSELIATHVGDIREPVIDASRRALDSIMKPAALKQKIPATPEERRSLFELLISRPGALPNEMTLAFRDGDKPSDRDIIGLLEDLEELGLLDQEEPPE